MYKISLFYSEKKGLHTKEEQIVEHDYEAIHIRDGMLFRWMKILCSHIDIIQYQSSIKFCIPSVSENYNQHCEMKFQFAYNGLQDHLKKMNELRKATGSTDEQQFSITMEEI